MDTAGLNNVKLNLGGGNIKMEGYINVDILPLANVDIVCDVTKGIPLGNDTVEAVWGSHFIEHIQDTVAMMEEIYRVCKKDAIVEFKLPYYLSTSAFKDPTHVKFLNERTWEYFDKRNSEKGLLPDYALKCNFRVEKISFIWYRRWYKLLPFKKSFFMPHFFNIAKTMYVKLRVVK